MPRPKGSKNKSYERKYTERVLKDFVKPKKKGWPKGKRRGPRKTLNDLHLEAYSHLNSSQINPKVDFKGLMIGIANFILYFLKK